MLLDRDGHVFQHRLPEDVPVPRRQRVLEILGDRRPVVAFDDQPAFAGAVVELMRDADKRRELEQAARRLVVERYDWSAVAQDFENALTTRDGHVFRQPVLEHVTVPV